MTTDTEICNMALDMAGVRANIASIDDNTQPARTCKRWYYAVRDDVLGKAQWNAGLTAVTLAVLKSLPGTPDNDGTATVWSSTLPMPYWNYEYAYPADCAKAMYVIPQGDYVSLVTRAQTYGLRPLYKDSAVPFKIANGGEARVILTNAYQAILIYIKRIPEALFDADLTRAIAATLAYQISIPLSGDKSLARGNFDLAERLVNEAILRDAQDGITVQEVPVDWLDARNEGPYYWPGWPIGSA